MIAIDCYKLFFEKELSVTEFLISTIVDSVTEDKQSTGNG